MTLNACACSTQRESKVKQPLQTAFGAWFKRIQGQRTGSESILAEQCLSFLDLSEAILHFGDFYGANFRYSNLRGMLASYAYFGHANLEGADLEGASLEGANLERADLNRANLEGAKLWRARLEGAKLPAKFKVKSKAKRVKKPTA